MRKDLYETLGIEPGAPDDEIKKAFRRLALHCHPDRNLDNPQAEERFKEANYAYSVLGSPEKRKRYDLYRQFHSRSVRWGFVPPESPMYDKVVEDFFLNASIAGLASGFPWSFKTLSQLHPIFSVSRIPLDFARRFFDAARDEGLLNIPLEFRVPRLSRPSGFRRNATGNPPGRTVAPLQEADVEWTLPLSRDEARRGTQLMLSFPADTTWEKVRLRIPAGVRSGVRLRVRNKGAQRAGRVSERGDLYLRIRVT